MFADDIHGSEPLGKADSSIHTIQEVCALFGFCLDSSKENPPCDRIDLLGAESSILADSIEAVVPGRKRDALVCDLKRVLELGRLSPAQAAKLRDRLGFAQSLMFGRVGRAHLAPLSDRQYTKVLGMSMPRSVSFSALTPVLLYTDATGIGHLRATLFYKGTEYRANAHLPAWFALSERQIGSMSYRLAALACALRQQFSQGALSCCSATIRAPRGPWSGARTRLKQVESALQCFWLVAAKFGLTVWIEFPRSGCNLSDRFSRMCLSVPPETGTIRKFPRMGCLLCLRRFLRQWYLLEMLLSRYLVVMRVSQESGRVQLTRALPRVR